MMQVSLSAWWLFLEPPQWYPIIIALTADYIFKCIFMNEKFCILIQISLNFVPEGPADNKQALVQVMAWRWTGD